MKLVKLQTDPYIMVDDSEIKEGDWVFNEKSKEIYPITIIEEVVYYEKKITHSTEPLEDYTRADGKKIKVYVGINPLNLFEVKELIGEVDVEKKLSEVFKKHGHSFEIAIPEFKKDLILLYNQCLEDNKDRKYTEENVLMILQKTARKYFKEGREYKGNMAIAGDPLHGLRSELREYIQSLQPKTEWEVEYDENGKLKLKQ